MSSLGANIRTFRERRNMSQEELAQKLRIGTKKIDDYESDRQVPSNETLLKISTVLDIPTSQLTTMTS
jgi:transcriptional regulator with XRE-family HTH domain